jgi:predicted ATPase
MKNNINIAGAESIIKDFQLALNQAESGKGKIMLLTGETGFGKSYVTAYLAELCKSKFPNILTAHIETQKPIGKFQVSNLQPLLPFSRVIEQLLQNQNISAEKKFARNVGMTTLAALPLIGDVFYAVKELGRDWREFKKDKSSAKFSKINSVTADYFDTLVSYCENNRLVLFMDDMHWSDSQSIELLNLIADKISELSMVIVLTARMSELQKGIVPLASFINNHKSDKKKLQILDIKQFGNDEIGKLAIDYVTNYKRNDEFETWIKQHSYGVPSVVVEYLKYFGKYSPFLPDGSLITNIDGNEYLPSSIQAVFAEKLEVLSDDEINILCVCSSEGLDFTATVVSNLLNQDVLTTIKKLRTIQNKSGIIQSTGAKQRYGIKTTSYKFTQAYYQNYFESLLEYEEYSALHGQIAAFLKQKYNEAQLDEQKQEIAPYLAAHSAEAGDNDAVKEMMLVAARTGEKYGNSELVNQAYNQYNSFDILFNKESTGQPDNPFMSILESLNNKSDLIEQLNSLSEGGNESDNSSVVTLDYFATKTLLIDLYHQQKFAQVADGAIAYYNANKDNMPAVQQLTLLNLAAKSLIELQNFTQAEDYVNNSLEILARNSYPEFECISYILLAIIRDAQNMQSQVYQNLQKAAKLSISLPAEIRLLTLANISLLTKSISPKESGKYYENTLKLTKTLNFKEFQEEFLKIYQQ